MSYLLRAPSEKMLSQTHPCSLQAFANACARALGCKMPEHQRSFGPHRSCTRMHENSSTAILHALMRAQQVSQASLGPTAGDSLDLSALDASIREEAEMFSKSSSAVSVHSGSADLDIMEPEATVCVSPREDDVRLIPG